MLEASLRHLASKIKQTSLCHCNISGLLVQVEFHVHSLSVQLYIHSVSNYRLFSNNGTHNRDSVYLLKDECV